MADKKDSLVEVRVAKRMKVLGIQNPRIYLKFLIDEKGGKEMVHFLDVISTNTTRFFREPQHFTFMNKIVKEMLEAGQSRIRIWCAASSTGEEPYTIAMTFMENMNGFKGDMRILATDISTKVLKKAKDGVFSGKKIKDIPPMLRSRYFSVSEIDKNKIYSVKPVLSNFITFARLNLSKPPFPMQGPFDIIFCRNVMIYFDNLVRSRLLAETERLLRPGGYLIVGLSESLAGMLCGLKNVMPGVLMKSA